jgi:mono/diheme cytochrome c family protein
VRWCIAIVLASCWTGQEPPPPRPAPPPKVVAAAPRVHKDCPIPDGNVDHGRRLVRTKHCLFCHRPKIAASIERACDPSGIRMAILGHTDTSNLSPQDLDDLVAYVVSAW